MGGDEGRENEFICCGLFYYLLIVLRKILFHYILTRIFLLLNDRMVTKYQNDPSLMKLISKHFYSERIYDDSTSNTPKLRWRYRNFFSDNAIDGKRTQDHGSYNTSQGDSHNDSYDESQGYSDSLKKSQDKSENIADSKRTTHGTKQISQGKSENITDSQRTARGTKQVFVSIFILPFTYFDWYLFLN